LNLRIAHITSSHTRLDNRIFFKQCCFLAKKNNVTLFVSDGLGNKKISNVLVVDLGLKFSRLKRFLILPFMMLKIIDITNYDVFHLHDPELLLIVPFIRGKRKIVIFDSHEDVIKQMLYKPYLNKLLLKIISTFYGVFQFIILKLVDGVVTSTPHIKNKLKKINSNSIDIKNYPTFNDN
jgi:hypothetical protein